jgi:hypothetical protein
MVPMPVTRSYPVAGGQPVTVYVVLSRAKLTVLLPGHVGDAGRGQDRA